MIDRKLMGFTQIVETKSYSLAADSLYISQSALSQQIKLLEQQLGFNLFDHKARQVKLTNAGEAFYPKAVQILSMYKDAVSEGVYISQAEKDHKFRLRLASHNDLYLQMWLDILPLADDISMNFAPFFTRYGDRLSMLRSLHSGETDLSIQIENPDIAALGLCFVPFATIHELCIPTQGVRLQPYQPYLSISDISEFVLAFHNDPGQTVFEDSLREHLKTEYPNTIILEPSKFYTAKYEYEILLLVPSVLVPNLQNKGAVPLEWGDNLRIGFVHSPKCSKKILSFAEHIMDKYSQNENLWI